MTNTIRIAFRFFLILCIAEPTIAQYSVELSYSFLTSSPITNASLYSPKADPGYLVSVKTFYSASNKIILESGISYSRREIVWGENIPNTFVDRFYDFYTPRNNLGLTEFVRWTESYSSIILQFICHYQFLLTDNSSILFGAGVHIGYLFERVNTVRYNDGWMDSKKNNSGEILGGTNLGLRYQNLFSDHLGFSLNAGYAFEFYPKEGKRDLTFKAYNFGAGVIIVFSKASIQ